MGKAIQLKNTENEKIYVCPYFPVGSIYLSVVNTNPTKWLGGTWEQIAKGRTLVGVDTSQAEFNTVKKTGGEKTHKLTIDEMPSHNHAYTTTNAPVDSANWEYIVRKYSWSSGFANLNSGNAGGDQPHNNLQPYFTCYIWLRTA